jgi:DNA-binding LacI/PurR family transcriptional regulator
MDSLTSSTTKKISTKSQDVHERLIEMATTLGPNAKLPTVQQLRRDLNVSLTTLDGVLKQLESQSIIFRKQGSGIFVSPRLKSKCVGLVCDPAFFSAGTSPFWQQLIEGARARASQNGEAFRFYLAMCSSDGGLPIHDDLIEDVKAQRIHGVLFLGNNSEAQKWLKQNNIPSVVFAGKGEHRVEIDVPQFINTAGQILIGKGCRRPALLCPWDIRANPPTYEEGDGGEWPDVKAFRQFLKEFQLPFHPELIWDTRSLGKRVESIPETHQEQGYQAVMNLFKGPLHVPDGLLSTDDMMTRGILAALRKLGLKPAQDVEIVSHINRGSTVLSVEDENIAFVEIDPAEIVSTMFTQLEKLMNNQTQVSTCIYIQGNYRN